MREQAPDVEQAHRDGLVAPTAAAASPKGGNARDRSEPLTNPRSSRARRILSGGALGRLLRRSRIVERINGTRFATAVRSSLSLRSALIITAAALVVITLFALLVASQLRASTFEARRDQILDDAAVRFSSAQSVFDLSTASTPDQIQEAARQTVEGIRSSAAGAGAVSVMLLRSPDASSSIRINQIVDTDNDELITAAMRQAIHSSGGAQWQSVQIGAGTDRSAPGILVGMDVELPRAGTHELYIVYSLASDQRQINMVMSVLFYAALPIILGLPIGVFSVLYQLLRPVRRTADAVKHIAAGDLEARVDVHGSDEMADLSRAFNEMASSLQVKIAEYDELSQLQQRFVSDVSHELRTPLTTIRMADSIIWDNRDSLPPGAKRSAELLHEQTDRMDSLFADLLEISRYDAQSADLEAEMTDLRLIVARVVEANAGLASRLGVTVSVNSPQDRCAAPIDVRRIERVLRNLLINALEFAERTRVDITIAATDTDVAVRVRDHGAGMSDETAARVFDRFYRADPSRQRTTGGTGLGLSIAAEDVALHHGTLEATGVIGRGASFLMILPRAESTSVSSRPLELWEEE